MAKESGFFLRKRPPRARKMLAVINRPLKKQMSTVADIHIGLRNAIVSTWEPENRGKFTKEIRGSGVGAGLEIIVKHRARVARKAKVSVYTLVDKGTSVRHVRMTSDFRPQTTPGTFRSRNKQGSVIKNNKGQPVIFFNQDPDGIEARNLDDEINAELLPEMIAAIKRGFRLAGHEINKR